MLLKKAPAVAAAAFVAGLQPKIQEQLQSIAVWWQTKLLTELVSNAHLCVACQEKDSETKLMALQIQCFVPGNTSRSRGAVGDYSRRRNGRISSSVPQSQKCNQDSLKDINIIAPFVYAGPFLSCPNSKIVSCLLDNWCFSIHFICSDFPAVLLSPEVANTVGVSASDPVTSPALHF